MDDKNSLKKERERFLISWLIKKLGLREEDVINHEGPDFIINYNGDRVGLEFTECQSLSIETNGRKCVIETNNTLYKLFKRYKERLIKCGERSKMISVSFYDCIYDVLKINKISDTIMNEIDARREMKHNGRWQDFKYVSDVYESDLPYDSIDIGMSDAFWYTPAKPQNISKCITEKNIKLPKYKEENKNINIKEYWLAIDFTEDRGTKIQEFTMPNVETEFKRVYLTNYYDVVQIK